MYASVLLFAATALAAADFPAPGTMVTFWRDAGCNPDASSEAMQGNLLPSANDDCISGTESLNWPTEPGDDTVQIAYYTGDGIPSSCNVAILQQATIQPGDCGSAIDVINGGTTGTCKKTKLPKKSGMAICCGGSGKGCSSVPSTKMARAPSANATVARRGKDVTEVKRSAPFSLLDKRDCSFAPSGKPYTSRGRQQITSASVSCPGDASSPCPITNMASITEGSSNTFGASDSITAGTDFFVDVQNTVSFSYMYTYSESTTHSQSYTINVPAGEQGYVTWTPTVSCVDGSFNGDCPEWKTGDGTACVPLYVSGNGGDAQGQFAFLQEQ